MNRHEEIDNILIEWGKRNSIYMYTKYQDEEVRSFEVINANGMRMQLWVEPTQCSGYEIRAWNYKCKNEICAGWVAGATAFRAGLLRAAGCERDVVYGEGTGWGDRAALFWGKVSVGGGSISFLLIMMAVSPHKPGTPCNKNRSQALTWSTLFGKIKRFGELTSAPVLPRIVIRTGWGPAPRFDQDTALDRAWASPKQFSLAFPCGSNIAVISFCGSCIPDVIRTVKPLRVIGCGHSL